MKRWYIILLAVCLLSGAGAVSSYSADEETTETDEGKGANVEMIKKEFNVSDEQIKNLRDKKLGYGEMNNVFTLANQMPGGINEENIKKITDMRLSGDHKVGWGKIAQDLKVKLKDKSTNETIDEKKEKVKAQTKETQESNTHSMGHKFGADKPMGSHVSMQSTSHGAGKGKK
jgi:hypothetical protein